MQTNDWLDNLPPEEREFWRMFQHISSVPHPSGEEARLAAELRRIATANGLKVRTDAVGNMRVDRPAAPGFEGCPRIILQGHLDMVPSRAPGSKFEFSCEGIPLKLEGDWVSSAAATTLGADDGIGVAAAMELLIDPAFKCGAVSGLFTVREEVGLDGAEGIDPELLEGDLLLNLDSEEEGVLYIGCAGGERLSGYFSVPWEPVLRGADGVEIKISGMLGGHSGCNIAEKRGNAVKLMFELLENCADLRLRPASIVSGTLENVIPSSARVRAVLPAHRMGELIRRVGVLSAAFAGEYLVAEDFGISVRRAALPGKVWSNGFTRTICRMVRQMPNGVIDYDEELGAVRTSSNLASVRRVGNRLVFLGSQRSLNDDERRQLTSRIAGGYLAAGGRVRRTVAYPGWTPKNDSPLHDLAVEVYREMFGLEPRTAVIHAGLECGIFAGKRPELEMLSFGPTILDPHGWHERISVSSAGRFRKFLRALVSGVSSR